MFGLGGRARRRLKAVKRAAGVSGEYLSRRCRAAWGAGRLVLRARAGVSAGSLRQNYGVRVERNRENVFTVTATGQELSALIAGARLALDAMRASPETPAAAIELLGRVLDDFDRSRQQLSESPRDGDRR